MLLSMKLTAQQKVQRDIDFDDELDLDVCLVFDLDVILIQTDMLTYKC